MHDVVSGADRGNVTIPFERITEMTPTPVSRPRFSSIYNGTRTRARARVPFFVPRSSTRSERSHPLEQFRFYPPHSVIRSNAKLFKSSAMPRAEPAIEKVRVARRISLPRPLDDLTRSKKSSIHRSVNRTRLMRQRQRQRGGDDVNARVESLNRFLGNGNRAVRIVRLYHNRGCLLPSPRNSPKSPWTCVPEG